MVTVIAGERKEAQSKPAMAGDRVVRNRCKASGHEQYLVSLGKFAERYEGPLGPADRDGWAPYRPRGVEMLYTLVRDQDGSFHFTAPWGEVMVARPGDALVRAPHDSKDLYRVQAAAFVCSYEIVTPPSRPVKAQWERSCNLTTFKQSLIRLERSGRSGLTNDENLP